MSSTATSSIVNSPLAGRISAFSKRNATPPDQTLATRRDEQTPGAAGVIILDAAGQLHAQVKRALSDAKPAGTPLVLRHADNIAQARELLRRHRDSAVLVLSSAAVPDTDWQEVVRSLQRSARIADLQLVLCLHDNAPAPGQQLLSDLGIQACGTESGATAEWLYTAVTASVRGFINLNRIRQLERAQKRLEGRLEEKIQSCNEIDRNLQQEVDHTVLTERALRAAEQRLSTIQRSAGVGSWTWHMDSDHLQFTDQARHILGLQSQDAAIDLSVFMDLVHPDDRIMVREALNKARIHQPYTVDHRIVHHDGEVRRIQQRGELLFDDVAGPRVLVVTVLDVTEQCRANAWEKNLATALDQVDESVMITDCRGVIEYVNSAFERRSGFPRREVVGNKPDMLRSGRHGDAFYQNLWQTVLRGETFRGSFVNRRRDGDLFHEEMTITPAKTCHDKLTHFVATGRDMTDHVVNQDYLDQIQHQDVLTGLANRRSLLENLTRMLQFAEGHRRGVVVLFMDIDRFKLINDTMGYDVGDQLLRGVAKRLTETVRDRDVVARLGTDEFAILLDDILTPRDVTKVTRKIVDALSAPFAIEGRELVITVSIGISLFPSDGQDPTALVKQADETMRRVKKRGGNGFKFYSDTDSAVSSERLALEAGLHKALENGDFILHYQPQFDLNSEKIIGAEALVRWNDADRGIISPGQFVPLAEENGMIVRLGEWVLRSACEQAMRWHDAGLVGWPVAVNLSSRQFEQPDLVAMIERVLNETGLAPEYLELEVTEGLLINDIKRAGSTLIRLSDMGIQLSLDDFGTGYSSLSYLRRLPFDTLKIDQSFVRDIGTDADSAAIISAIISLADALGLRTLAEGVETVRQSEFLRAQGCQYTQGFLYSQPLPVPALERLITNPDTLELGMLA